MNTILLKKLALKYLCRREVIATEFITIEKILIVNSIKKLIYFFNIIRPKPIFSFYTEKVIDTNNIIVKEL